MRPVYAAGWKPGKTPPVQNSDKIVRTLSIVIAAHNEERFIRVLLERVRAVDLSSLGIDKQIIVVDDGSSDQTAQIAASVPGVLLHRAGVHRGKGSAIKIGIGLASGDYLIFQDADLEYDPCAYAHMLPPLLDRRADIVFGSRYLRSRRYPRQSLAAYCGGRSLSLVAFLVTGRYLTDPVTALRLFKRADLVRLPLETNGFELDHEITARLLARGARIFEVPIGYAPRTRAEGKKITARDWFIAVRTLWRYRRG